MAIIILALLCVEDPPILQNILLSVQNFREAVT